MIVTCPNCSTKFNLPETQAAPGAKLRCSVCKHVFQLSDGVKPAEIRMEPDLSLSSPSLSMPPKKKGGIWGWVLTLLILCAVAGGTWWAWTYTPLFDTVKEMIAPPKKQDPVELVKNIALRGVRQYNISNEKLGNISVVEGKVVNGLQPARELIRIEASLYDSAGNALVFQAAACGHVPVAVPAAGPRRAGHRAGPRQQDRHHGDQYQCPPRRRGSLHGRFLQPAGQRRRIRRQGHRRAYSP